MARSLRILLFLCVAVVPLPAIAQQKSRSVEIAAPTGYSPLRLVRSASLDAILRSAVDGAIRSLAASGFKAEEIAATIIDLRDPKDLTFADFRGEARIYPASVVKLFYLAALERQLEDGKVRSSAELERGRRDMIVDSSNEATQYILDVLTGTSSGAELPKRQFEAWQYKRDRVNRFFKSLGYTNINVNQKTFCEDAYGIEQQSRNYNGQNRNMLTTNATARLMSEIVLGRIAGTAGTEKMMELLRRDPFAATNDSEDQAHGFSGISLIRRQMTNARLWSKAGWTSKARHDVAYIDDGNGLRFVLAVFTENHATVREAIPMILDRVLDGLKKN